MDEEIKETLKKQLQLLFERSKADEIETIDLARLSDSMVEIAKLIL